MYHIKNKEDHGQIHDMKNTKSGIVTIWKFIKKGKLFY